MVVILTPIVLMVVGIPGDVFGRPGTLLRIMVQWENEMGPKISCPEKGLFFTSMIVGERV